MKQRRKHPPLGELPISLGLRASQEIRDRFIAAADARGMSQNALFEEMVENLGAENPEERVLRVPARHYEALSTFLKILNGPMGGAVALSTDAFLRGLNGQ